MKLLLALAFVALSAAHAQTLPTVPGTPQRVIIDTDIGTDIDDSHALAVALRLRKLGYFNILALTISTWQDKAAAFANLMLAHGGLTTTDIPIGAYQGSNPSVSSCSNDATDNYPNFVLAYFLTNSITPNVPNVGRASFPSAVTVLRKALATSPDASVIVITLGGLTNISALMQSAANTGGDGYASGQSLWNTKVMRMSSQLSGYPSTFPYTASPFTSATPGGYNGGCDVPAAKYVFEHNGVIPILGVPMQVSMYMGGCYDGAGAGCTATLPTNSPVRWASDHFRNLFLAVGDTSRYTIGSGNKGAAAWDPSTIFYTVVGVATPPGSIGSYYTQSPNGSLSFVVSPASSTWTTASSLNHYFVINSSNWTNEQALLDTMLMADYVPTGSLYTITPATSPVTAYTILETTAQCGDTVAFSPGTWDLASGNLFRARIVKACTAGNPLTIRAANPSNRPNINLRYAPVNGLPGDYTNSDLDRGFIQITNSSYVTVDGLKITGAGSTTTPNTAGIRIVFSDHIVIRNSYFQQNFNGIFATSTNSTYEYNEFRGNGYYGNEQSHQFYESGGDNVTVRYNTFLGNGTGPSDTCCLLEDGSAWPTGGGQNLHLRSWHAFVYGNWFQDGRDYEFDQATPGNCPTLTLAPVGWCTNPSDLTQRLTFYNNTVVTNLTPENEGKVSAIQSMDGVGWNAGNGFTGGHQAWKLYSNTFILREPNGAYTGGANSPPNDFCCQYSLVQFVNDSRYADQSLDYSNNVLHFLGSNGYKRSLFHVNTPDPSFPTPRGWAVTGHSNWFNSDMINACATSFSGSNGTCLLTGTVLGVPAAGAAPFTNLSTLSLGPNASLAFGTMDASVTPLSLFSATAPNTYIPRSSYTDRGAMESTSSGIFPTTSVSGIRGTFKGTYK